MMEHLVIKRDGTTKEFKFSKVKEAANKALEAVGKSSLTARQQEKLLRHFTNNETFPMHVESIQDIVETYLMIFKQHDAAKAFILYRDAKRRERGGENE